MSNMRDESTLKAVAEVIKIQVGKVFVALGGRIEAVEHDLRKRISEIPHGPKGEDGKDSPPVDEQLIVESVLKRIPAPIAAKDGKDAPPVDEKAIIAALVERIPAPIPGEKGKDAPPVNEKAIAESVLKLIPPPIPGKAGDPGKDAPAVDLKALADAVLARVPVPANGKDAPPINEQAIIEAVLKRIPTPAPGKDGANAPPVDEASIIEKVLARIPVPKDGKNAESVDLVSLEASVAEKVLARIPPPIPGEPGKNGSSVDLDSVRVLIAGEVHKAVSSLPVPDRGRDGLAGLQGLRGPTGLDGKDAADIEVLDGIDESVSYQRGQWAHHRGGLIKAYRTTDPIKDGDLSAAGWQVIHEGICDFAAAIAPDGRTMVISLVETSGKTLTSQVKLPTLNYRDVWVEAKEYEQGDAVTLAGSTWHANRTTKDRPGTSSAWTLMVKRGSDARGAGLTLNGSKR